jgi:hypothetical protein
MLLVNPLGQRLDTPIALRVVEKCIRLPIWMYPEFQEVILIQVLPHYRQLRVLAPTWGTKRQHQAHYRRQMWDTVSL